MKTLFCALLWLTLCWFRTMPVLAQQIDQPGLVMLKLTSAEFHLDKPPSATLKSQLQQFGATWKQLFPNQKPAPGAKSRSGLPLVDISLMYEITLANDAQKQELIKLLNQLPEVAYAEPKSYYPPLFQPNDPHADSLRRGQATFLKRLKAYQAWQVYQGDTSISIGVLDTGCKWDHEDFETNIQYNYNDPINGTDDDANGYTDDYRGWDMSSNDNNPMPEFLSVAGGHGNEVSGMAAAATNNAKGVASLGFKCRLLPVKVYNFNGSQFSNFTGFEGIVYAADRGCKVINLSWGGARNGLQFEQDIIAYAAINKDVVVVAAAGNTPQELNFMPASYKYVLSVAAIDSFDRRSTAGTFSRAIDLTAPGVNVWGLDYRGGYFFTQSGSSIASPIAASAAALSRGRWPDLNALQISEFMKVNGDIIDSVPANRAFAGKLGKGRINALKLMQGQNKTSIRLENVVVRSQNGFQFLPGDTVSVWPEFLNYLDPVDSMTVQFSIENETYPLLWQTNRYGAMGSMETAQTTIPFRFVIPANVPVNRFINLVFSVSAPSFNDKEYHRMVINSEWLDIDTNRVRLTATSNGRFGFLNDAQTIGSGIQLNGKQMSSAGGWMIGYSPRKLSNSVFGINVSNNHFKPLQGLRYRPYPGLHQHAVGHFNDSLAGDSSLGLHVKHSHFALNHDSLNGVVFNQLELQNRSGQIWDSLCIGLYTDFEVRNFRRNKAAYDSVLRLGYSYSATEPAAFAGMVLLTNQEPGFFAIDAIQSTANGNINLFDGFSKTEKWRSISNGLARKEAGTTTPEGNNVVQVQSAKLRGFIAGEKRKVAFAYVLGDSLEAIKKQARAAQHFYRQLNTSPTPQLPAIVRACIGDTVELAPQNGSAFYFRPIGLLPVIFTGRSLRVPVRNDTTGFWVSCIDSLYESALVQVLIVKSVPSAAFSVSPDSLILNNSTQANFAAQEVQTQYRWYVNDTLAGQSAQLTWNFERAGLYQICLSTTDDIGCRDSVCRGYRVLLRTSSNLHLSEKPKLMPNPASQQIQITWNQPVGSWEIVNMLGERMSVQKDEHRQIVEINVKQWPAGLYLLRTTNADGQSVYQKFVKQ